VADRGLKPIFICNCCPRAPRQFQTSEELAYVFSVNKPSSWLLTAEVQTTRS
jgi:hypothetical protein